VGENVRGLTNWNDGVVFDEVCADLENFGYQVAPVIIPACATNAPHKRERVWFVAYSAIQGRTERQQSNRWPNAKETGAGLELWPKRLCSDEPIANTNSQRCEKRDIAAEPSGPTRQHSEYDFGSKPGCWDNFPTQSPICGRNDGVPGGLDGITFSKWRNESVKAYGNAIVPQVAYQIFKAIEAASAQMQNIVSL
jgi:DNA (cytosine-5)-methyltransferase 1